MAVLLKNSMSTRVASPGSIESTDQAFLYQWIHVNSPARLVPANGGTDILFRVIGGRVLVHLMMAEVTVIMDGTDPVLKYSSQALTVANPPVASGTAVDIAATADISSLEVGGQLVVLGSGAAYVKSNAGVALSTLGRCSFVLPAGQVYLTTGGTNATGFLKHDLWYQPLDEGAYVVNNGTATIAKF